MNSTDSKNKAQTTESSTIIRILDVLIAVMGLIFLSPVLIVVYVMALFDTGSPLFIQERVGRLQRPFKLVKFRTMNRGTASVGSHLANQKAVTKFGRILRKTKLDELPQLWNVLKGEMSLVGPRPGLANQVELTKERSDRGIYKVRPGITGVGQLANVDMSTPRKLARYDRITIGNMNPQTYLKLIIATALGKGSGDAIRKP